MKKYILIFFNILMLCDGARASGLSDCVIMVLADQGPAARPVLMMRFIHSLHSAFGAPYNANESAGLITYRNVVRRVRLVDGGTREVPGTLQIRFETSSPELFFTATDPLHRLYEVDGRGVTNAASLQSEFAVLQNRGAQAPEPSRPRVELPSNLREGLSISFPENPFDDGGNFRTFIASANHVDGERSVGIVRRMYRNADGDPVVEVEQLSLVTRGEYVQISRRLVELSPAQVNAARPSQGARVLAEYDRVLTGPIAPQPARSGDARPGGEIDIVKLRNFLQMGVRESAVVERHRRAIESQRFSGIELRADPIQADGSRSVNLFFETQGHDTAENRRLLRQLSPREWERLIRITEQVPVYEVEVTDPNQVRAQVQRGLPTTTGEQDNALLSDRRNHIYFQHYILQARELGVRIEYDPITGIRGGAAFYSPPGSRILLGPDSTLGYLRHEFMHAAFDKTGAKNIYSYLYERAVTHRRPVTEVQAEARAQLNGAPPTTAIFLTQWRGAAALRAAIAARTGRSADTITLREVFNHYSVPIDYAVDRLLPNHTPQTAANERMATYLERVACRVNRDGGFEAIPSGSDYAGARGIQAERYGLKWERYELRAIPESQRTSIQRRRLDQVVTRIREADQEIEASRSRGNLRWWWPF